MNFVSPNGHVGSLILHVIVLKGGVFTVTTLFKVIRVEPHHGINALKKDDERGGVSFLYEGKAMWMITCKRAPPEPHHYGA